MHGWCHSQLNGRDRSINQALSTCTCFFEYFSLHPRLARLDIGQTLATAKPVFARGNAGATLVCTPMSHFPEKPPTQAFLRAQRQPGVRGRDPRRATGPFTLRIGPHPEKGNCTLGPSEVKPSTYDFKKNTIHLSADSDSHQCPPDASFPNDPIPRFLKKEIIIVPTLQEDNSFLSDVHSFFPPSVPKLPLNEFDLTIFHSSDTYLFHLSFLFFFFTFSINYWVNYSSLYP